MNRNFISSIYQRNTNNMKREFFLSFLTLCALFVFSPRLFAQTYYEFSYKNPDGKQCNAFMIYENNEKIVLRVAEADNDAKATKDLLYTSKDYAENDEPYTAFVPTSPQENIPYLVFFWDKLEDATPSISFNLKNGNFKTLDSFTEIDLADITSEYLQRFYNTEEPMYKSIMTAKNKVQSERDIINGKFGDDTYHGVCSLFDDDDSGDASSSYQGDDNDNSNYDNSTSIASSSSSYEDDDDSNSSNDEEDGSSNSDDSSNSGNHNSSSNNNNNTSNSGNNSSTNNDANKPSPHDPNITLHLIIVAETTDNRVGIACKTDYNNFHNEMKSIAEALGIKFKEYPVMDANFNKDGVEQALNDLKPSANDIVFFTYTGHGGRYGQKDGEPFPGRALRSKDQKSKRTFYFSEVYKEICAKKARLTFVLSDCCNKGSSNRSIQETTYLRSRSNNNYSLARLGQLFLKERGSMIATACSPGEGSRCTKRYGGHFIANFLITLRSTVHAANNQALSWNKLMDDTFVLLLERTGQRQHGVKKSTFK